MMKTALADIDQGNLSDSDIKDKSPLFGSINFKSLGKQHPEYISVAVDLILAETSKIDNKNQGTVARVGSVQVGDFSFGWQISKNHGVLSKLDRTPNIAESALTITLPNMID